MTRLSPFGLALLATLLLVGCETPVEPLPDPITEPTADLLPLAVGNEWVLDYTQTLLALDRVETGVDTVRVAEVYRLYGEEWAVVEASGGVFAALFEGHYANREDGVWKWNPETPEGATVGPYLLYKKADEAGETYTVPFARSNATMTVSSVDEIWETAAGTFASTRYTFDADSVANLPIAPGAARFDRVLAPGVGFVYFQAGYVSTQGGDGSVLTRSSEIDWTLVSFTD